MSDENERERHQRIEAVFFETVGRPAAERADFLAAACGADAEMRREVERLLALDDDQDAFLDATPWTTSVRDDVLTAGAGRGAAEGTVVGRYRLVRRIGRGGMGEVWLAARADEAFEDRVALKLIRRGLDTDDLLARFRNERQVLANLRHPNIATLLDGGATDDGRPYLVMEHVDGVTIDAWCREQHLSLEARLELFLKVCAAVQHAHRNLVVHRDIKPSNVLVDRGGEPKLLDFGIAKVVEPGGDETEVTMTSERRFTPLFASPEQARGEALTTATDVYSLGALLYLILTGTPPHDLTGVAPTEYTRVICDTEPRRPSDVVARDAGSAAAAPRHRLAGDLDRIVLMALRPEPDRRYDSVEQLADDVRRHRAGLPVRAQPDTFRYRAGKFVRRNRTAFAASAIVAMTLVATTIISVVLLLDARAARGQAERETRTATAINDFLNTMLASVDPREAGVDVTVREVLGQAAARVEDELSGHGEVEQGVRRTIGRSYAALGLYEDARPHFERALALVTAIDGDDHPTTTDTMNELGRLLRNLGRYADAEALHRRALELDVARDGADSLAAAQSMNALAQVLYDQGDFEEGRPLYERSYEIRADRLGETDPAFIESVSNLSRERFAAGDYAGAEILLRQVLELRREILGSDHIETIAAMGNVAFIAMNLGKYEESERLFRESLAAYRREYDGPHPDVARALNNLGECIRRQRRSAEAAAVHREAVAMRRETLGEDHALTAVSMNNLALALSEVGDYEEATQLHETALAIRREQLGPRHPMVASSLGNLGFVHRHQGALDRAIARTREALDIRLEAYDADHPLVANSQMNLAHCLQEAGELDEAQALATAALTSQEQRLGPEHPHANATRGLLGRILLEQARYAEAEPLLLGAYENLTERFDPGSSELEEFADDLVALYERWDRPAEADRWRSRLETGRDGS